jgi:hypothetical protein
MPALRRDLLHAAQCEPDVARRGAGRQSLVRCAIAELDDDGVFQQYPAERAELFGDRVLELAELQRRTLSG